MSIVLLHRNAEEYFQGCVKITPDIVEEKIGGWGAGGCVLRILKILPEYHLIISRENPDVLKYDGQLVWVDRYDNTVLLNIWHPFASKMIQVKKEMVKLHRPKLGAKYCFFVRNFEDVENSVRVNCLYHTYVQQAKLWREFKVIGNKMIAIKDIVKWTGFWRNEVPAFKEEKQEFVYKPLEFLGHDFEFKEVVVPKHFFNIGRKEEY